MSKNTQNTQTLTKKENFLKALESKHGHISEACIAATIHRRTYYSWLDKDEEFKIRCEEIEESLLDLAESKLLDNIKKGDNTCIIFYLKTRGKKRGYVEKQEFEVVKPISEINFDEI